jgi:hypothetical protein
MPCYRGQPLAYLRREVADRRTSARGRRVRTRSRTWRTLRAEVRRTVRSSACPPDDQRLHGLALGGRGRCAVSGGGGADLVSPPEQSRLRIFDHPGAMFLSIAIRDPDFTSSEHGLVVVTPRWFKDETSHQRMFFAIEQRANPEIFNAITGEIYPSIKVDQGLLTGSAQDRMGGRSIDKICQALGVESDREQVRRYLHIIDDSLRKAR